VGDNLHYFLTRGSINRILSLAFFCLLLAWPANALQLQYIGIVGNSGAAGTTLIRSTRGRLGGGVAVDKEGRIYTSGGDHIVVLNRDGKRLWENRLPSPDWVVGGPTFAITGNYLYFLAGKPIPYADRSWSYEWSMVEPNLCRVGLRPDAVAEVQVAANQFKNYSIRDISLSAIGESVYVGYTTSWSKPEYSVFQVSDHELKLLFTAPTSGGYASVDERGNFYLGGGRSVRKVDREGHDVPGFPQQPLADLGGAISSVYLGNLMLTRDAIWDTAALGYLGRYSREYKPDPGTVGKLVIPLSTTAQIADGLDGNYYIRSTDAVYEASLIGGVIKLERRFGALPRVLGLGITANGYIGAGYEDTMLWWDFDNNDPAAAPVRGQFFGPLAQGFADGNENWIAISGDGWPLEYNPRAKRISIAKFAPEQAGFDTQYQRLSTGIYDPPLQAVTEVGDYYFAIDRGTHGLLRSRFGDQLDFQSLPVKEFADDNKLNSLCAVSADTLILSGSGVVAAYRVNKDGTLQLTWTTRGDASTRGDFGRELYVASSGNQILVADTLRHRVVLLSLNDSLDKPPTGQAQFGVTDEAGDDTSHLHAPTLVALQGGIAAVYDSANCRIVKLRLR
jgi:hypothetical protein